METSPSRGSIANLVALGTDECLKFIQTHYPSKFDWGRLVEAVVMKASSHITLGEPPLDSGLEWIRVAVELYDRMAEHLRTVEQKLPSRLVLPSIALRVRAIEIWGAREGDPVLDPEEIATRFHALIEVSSAMLRDDKTFPRPAVIREALELTKYVEPMTKLDALRLRFPELVEYCESARIARNNARAGLIATKE